MFDLKISWTYPVHFAKMSIIDQFNIGWQIEYVCLEEFGTSLSCLGGGSSLGVDMECHLLIYNSEHLNYFAFLTIAMEQ